MKALQILNAAAIVTGGAMAINLAVVCVLYLANVGSDPRIAADLPRLYALTAWFTMLGLAGAGAFLAQRRHWPARWLLQALPLAPVLGLALFLAGLRG